MPVVLTEELWVIDPLPVTVAVREESWVEPPTAPPKLIGFAPAVKLRAAAPLIVPPKLIPEVPVVAMVQEPPVLNVVAAVPFKTKEFA